jgi:plasmid stability protein
MPALLIPEVDETLLVRLRQRAAVHGRTPEAEAKLILLESLPPPGPQVWAEVNALHDRLAASGRSFSDSAELLREDRDR